MSRRRQERNNIKIFSVILVIVVVIVILSYTVKNKKNLNPVEKIVKDCVVEVQAIMTFPIKSLINIIDDYNLLKSVLEENKILKFEKI